MIKFSEYKGKELSEMWVYGGSVTDGYVKGNDELGHNVWVPLTSVVSITELDCGNRK